MLGPNNILIKCADSCKTCSEENNENACLTCYDNYNLISGKCINAIDLNPSITQKSQKIYQLSFKNE